MQHSTRWSVSGWLASTTLATVAFWSIFGACVDASNPPSSSSGVSPEGGASSTNGSSSDDQSSGGASSTNGSSSDDQSSGGASSDAAAARAIIAWDPRLCGEPHRVIVELDDPGGSGEPIAASVPCALGAVTFDTHAGIYDGRAYAWTADATMQSVTPFVLTLEPPVTRREVPTPR